jgi:hypothetical protein
MVQREGIVEEQANYSVLRLKQDVFSNSSVGGMLTLTSQNRIDPATTGGVDWRLSTESAVWNFSGQAVFSRVGDIKTGFGMTAEVYKAAGKHIRGSIGMTIKDPNLDLNRIGFLSRNDERKGYGWLQYRTQDDWWIIRNTYNNFNVYAGWNYDGANIQKGWNFNTFIEFTNKWSLGGGFNQNLYKFSDRETRGNGLWEIPHDSWSWWASFNTDEGKMVSLNINPGSGHNRNANWWANYIGLEYRPKSNMEFSAGVNYVQDNGETRWVENREDTTIFANMFRDQITPRFSASILPHRNLSIQLSAQGIIAGLDYRDARRYLGGNDYEEMAIAEDNYDYNYSALNSSMIVRWEYLPGSTIYMVWTRSRGEVDSDVNNLDVSRDMKRLFSNGANNVWLVKASYWWNI